MLTAFAALVVPLTIPSPSLAAPVDAIPGAAWSGTIKVDSVEFFAVGNSTYEILATGAYQNLVRLDSGDGNDSFYQAYVDLDFTQKRSGVCYATNVFQLLDTSKMMYSGRSTATVDSAEDDDIQFVPAAFELWDTADGTYFYPYHALFNAPTTGSCGESIPVFRLGSDSLSYQQGYQPPPDSPLVDTDPDPDRLVGTTVYTLETIPGGPVWNYIKYSYTITYDLTRGLSELDSDSDGIFDAADLCPIVYGVAEASGCPPFSVVAGYAMEGVAIGFIGTDGASVSSSYLSWLDEVCIESSWTATVKNPRTSTPVIWNDNISLDLTYIFDIDTTLPTKTVGPLKIPKFPNGIFKETIIIKACTKESILSIPENVYSVSVLSGNLIGLTHSQKTIVKATDGSTMATLSVPSSSAGKTLRIRWSKLAEVNVGG